MSGATTAPRVKVREATGQVDTGAAPPGSPELVVYYDGSCPLCRQEINFYRCRGTAAAVEWVDASASDAESVAPDLKRAEALARFHVRRRDGSLASGSRGFAELWAVTPGFRWLGRIARTSFANAILEPAYRGFLRVRPAAQRFAAYLDSRADSTYPRWLERDLRSNHAGETGAVAIYRGILALSRNAEVREFARRHLETERRHLATMCELLTPRQRSKLSALWYVAGFITGAVPAIFGARAVYATIEGVETFVDRHYREQIARLRDDGRWAALRDTLEACRQDEVAHRDEARRFVPGTRAPGLRLWLWAVAAGSAAGVAVARRV